MRKILVIDDDALYADSLILRLRSRGFDTLSLTSNLDTVLDVISKEQIELVLLDMVMPNHDGKEILKTIRSRYDRSSLPIIMVTGMDSSDDVSESFELGATDYIAKPISFDVAVARIAAHLTRRDLDKEIIKKKELEVLNAMISTCCHEINNPLTIVMSEMVKFQKNISEGKSINLSRMQDSLQRICLIMRKIQKAGDHKEVLYESYLGGSKMVKIK